ncbi:MAG: hypothetical protein V1806_11445 [Pseudomonadota bacterium]
MTHPPTIASRPAGPPRLQRWFIRLLVAAVLLRLLIGLGLFLWGQGINPDYPVAAMSQRLMAPDGQGYHTGAMKVHEYWADPNPHKVLRHEHMVARFSVLVGAAYHLIWPHPLVMTLLNCLCYLGVGLLARGLGLSLGQPPARAAGLALIICLWPPSLAWSALPMKDSVSVFLIFAILSQMLYLARGAGGSWPRGILAGAGLLLCAGLMIYTRFYFGYVVLAASALPLLARLLPSPQPGPRPAWPALLGVLALGVAAFALTQSWHREYFVYFEQGELLPRSQFEAAISQTYSAHKPTAPPAAAPAPETQAEPARPDPPRPPQDPAHLWRELNGYRERFQHFAGRSLAPDADASLGGGLLHALRDIMLFPYPWQRWPATQHWTAMNLLVSTQGLLWYGLLLGILPGIYIHLRRRPDAALPLALWGLGLGILLAFVVLNRGTLFRLRDMALMPLVLFWDMSWLGRWRRKQPPPPVN